MARHEDVDLEQPVSDHGERHEPQREQDDGGVHRHVLAQEPTEEKLLTEQEHVDAEDAEQGQDEVLDGPAGGARGVAQRGLELEHHEDRHEKGENGRGLAQGGEGQDGGALGRRQAPARRAECPKRRESPRRGRWPARSATTSAAPRRAGSSAPKVTANSIHAGSMTSSATMVDRERRPRPAPAAAGGTRARSAWPPVPSSPRRSSRWPGGDDRARRPHRRGPGREGRPTAGRIVSIMPAAIPTARGTRSG